MSTAQTSSLSLNRKKKNALFLHILTFLTFLHVVTDTEWVKSQLCGQVGWKRVLGLGRIVSLGEVWEFTNWGIKISVHTPWLYDWGSLPVSRFFRAAHSDSQLILILILLCVPGAYLALHLLVLSLSLRRPVICASGVLEGWVAVLHLTHRRSGSLEVFTAAARCSLRGRGFLLRLAGTLKTPQPVDTADNDQQRKTPPHCREARLRQRSCCRYFRKVTWSVSWLQCNEL